MKKYDFISGVVWLGVGLSFGLGGFALGFGQWKAPGPGFFPVLIGGVLSLLSIALLVSTRAAPLSLPEPVSFWKERQSWKKVLAALLSLLFYMGFLNSLGYLLTTFLFIFFLVRFIGKKGWVLSIAVAVLSSGVSYWVFHTLLQVSLPAGSLGITR